MQGGGQELLTRAVKAAETYNRLLSSMHDVTDQLLAAIQDWDTERTQELIEARSDLCQKTSQCAELLDLIVPEVQKIEKGKDKARDTFDRLMDQAQTNLTTLLDKQASSERLMASGLRRCAQELATFRQRRELKSAYRQPAHIRDSRFIDTRF